MLWSQRATTVEPQAATTEACAPRTCDPPLRRTPAGHNQGRAPWQQKPSTAKNNIDTVYFFLKRKQFQLSQVSANFFYKEDFSGHTVCCLNQLYDLWGPLKIENAESLFQKLLIASRWIQQNIKPRTRPFYLGLSTTAQVTRPGSCRVCQN